MKKNKVVDVKFITCLISICLLLMSIILGITLTNNTASLVFKIIASVISCLFAIYAFAKGNKTYKIVLVAVLLSIILSYIIPSTTISYNSATKGTISPVTFMDAFTDLIYSFNVFIPTFFYILVVGIFYYVLEKTGKYEVLVNNTAASFNKNKGLFVVLTIFVLGIISFFTGELYSLILFVPFLISVAKKLGYSNFSALLMTIGSILIGNSATIHTYYINEVLSLSANNNLLTKVILLLVGLVFLTAFLLVFSKKPESTKELVKDKTETRNIIPIIILMIITLALIVLGFISWSDFGYKGFETFLTNLRAGKLSKVSVFDALVGKTIVAFGTWQILHLATIVLVVSALIGIIYRIKLDDFFDAIIKGLKKAFPYAMLCSLSILVLVSVAYSGIYYTLISDITSKSVKMLQATLTGILSAFFCPDPVNGTQFSMYAAQLTKASGYKDLLAVVYQLVYSLFLLISPTSIILLLGLRYTNSSYKDWFKFVYKYFFIMLITALVVASICVNGIDTTSIVVIILLALALFLIISMKFTKRTNTAIKEAEKVNSKIVEDKKEENKKEIEKVSETKKEVNKNNTKVENKKNNKKTNTKSKNSKKNNKK